jgi:hypothetical protein
MSYSQTCSITKMDLICANILIGIEIEIVQIILSDGEFL